MNEAVAQFLDLKFMSWRATDRGWADEILSCLRPGVDVERTPPIRGWRCALHEPKPAATQPNPE